MSDTESNEVAGGARKGLWALMGQKKPDEVVPAESTSEPTAAIPSEVGEPPATETPTGRPKGLWSLMQQADSSTVEVEELPQTSSQDDSPVAEEMRNAFEAPLKGTDRRLLQTVPANPRDEPDQPSPPPIKVDRRIRQMQMHDESAASVDKIEQIANDFDAADQTLVEVVETEPPSPPPIPGIVPLANLAIPVPAQPMASGVSRNAWWSVVLGGISLPVSLVAIVPEIWSRVPPSVCGFAALLLGFLGISEVQRTKGRMRGRSLAIAGIAMGLLGMFAGPMIYFPLDVFGKICDWHTGGHIRQIGMATDAYFQSHDAYPSGGIVHTSKVGDSESRHGWMTQILPNMPDGAPLFQEIDLEKPYSDEINQPVMRKTIPAFLAAGGDTSLVQDKDNPAHQYGPAHFAGLGGTLTMPDGSIAHVGVFDINSDTTRDDVVDGLSHTMLVGEIGNDYPAWGDPKNWRQIGKGLNRDPRGFGNARHSGALFLMADGSVKFFPNQTDPKVLQALSTRDGEEGF